MTNEIGLAAAHYAEKAVAALTAGDLATAIGALASIDQRSWDAMQERFPGFPSPDAIAALSAVWQRLDTAAGHLPPPRRILPGVVSAAGYADVIT